VINQNNNKKRKKSYIRHLTFSLNHSFIFLFHPSPKDGCRFFFVVVFSFGATSRVHCKTSALIGLAATAASIYLFKNKRIPFPFEWTVTYESFLIFTPLLLLLVEELLIVDREGR
jgi:hypothetical protein